MDWTEQRAAIVPPPSEVRQVRPWDTVEAALTVTFPVDDKRFAETNGSVSIAALVWTSSPCRRNRNPDLVRGVLDLEERSAGRLTRPTGDDARGSGSARVVMTVSPLAGTVTPQR